MESKQESNSKLYPECWAFFIEYARNMTGTEFEQQGKYRVPMPDESGNFLYADHPGELFCMLKEEFYKPSIKSPSVYGKIQYIVQNLNH